MTVWIETPFDNLPAEGSREMRYWSLARAFRAAGHDVFVFASSFNHATKSPRSLDGASGFVRCSGTENSFLSPDGIRVVLVGAPPYARNVSLARIRSHLSHARAFGAVASGLVASGDSPPPTVVVAAVPTLSAALRARALAGGYGAKCVIDVQDAWPETFYRVLPRGLGWFGRVLFHPLHRAAAKLYRGADLVAGVSRRYGELTGRGDFYLAPLGIPSAAGEVRASRQGRVKRLVYAGNLGRGYALGTVIEALRADAELTLDIAGEGEMKGHLRNLAGRCGVADRVRFHGWIGGKALQDLLASCDAGVIPMRDDSWVGLPNKLFDYLAASLPVISSLHGECGELLARTKAGVVYDISSPGSFIEALGRLGSVCADPVAIPEELRSEAIYPAFVERIEKLVCSPEVPACGAG